MMDGRSGPAERRAGRGRWTSFVADSAGAAPVSRALHEETNPAHRLRVEHDRQTLLIHLSDEDGHGWTTIAVDRATREWSVAQRETQGDAASAAVRALYDEPADRPDEPADRAAEPGD